MLKRVPVIAPVSFPTLVYRSPGAHFGPPVDGVGTTYDALGVADDAELAAAINDGWWPTLVEAVDPSKRLFTGEPELPDATVTLDEALAEAHDLPPAAIIEEGASIGSHDAPGCGHDSCAGLPGCAQVPELDRAALEAEAKELGVAFGNRISDAKLAERIAEARAKSGA